MSINVFSQNTPNPNTVKFIIDRVIKTEGRAVFKSLDEAGDLELVRRVMSLPHVTEVSLAANFVTVTQDGGADWEELERDVKRELTVGVAYHSPDFKVPGRPVPQGADGEDLKKIETIIDQTIRPALQMHGGDLEIIDYHQKMLRIHYQGACGCCPSATFGTLQLIEGVLREQFDPEITVMPA